MNKMKNVLFAVFLVVSLSKGINCQNDTTLASNQTLAPTTTTQRPPETTTFRCIDLSSGVVTTMAPNPNITTAAFNPNITTAAFNPNITTVVLANITTLPPCPTISASVTPLVTTLQPQTTRAASTLPTPTTPRPNLLLGVDINIVFLIRTYLNNTQNDSEVLNNLRNIVDVMRFFGQQSKDFWKSRCDLASSFYKVAEVGVRNDSLKALITQDAMTNPAVCKKDCNFLPFFQTNVSTDNGNFTRVLMQSISSDLIPTCKNVLAAYITLPPQRNNLTSAEILDSLTNGVPVSFFTPTQLSNLDSTTSLQLAKSISSGTKIDSKLASSIVRNLPSNASLASVVGVAAALPPSKFSSIPPADIASNIEKIDLTSMNTLQLGAIGANIMKDKSAAETVLKNTNNKNLKNSLSLSALKSAGVDFTSIPPANLPKSVGMDEYKTLITGGNTLDKVTDVTQLGRVLTGIKAADIKAMPENNKLNQVVNILNASATSGVELTSSQRSALRDALISGLVNVTGSSVPATYLNRLTNDQVALVYELFIEASETILDAFLTLNTKSTLFSKAAAIASSKCCSFIRANRAKFVLRMLQYLNINSAASIQSSDLTNIGTCFIAVLPSDYINALGIDTIVTYFGSLGYNFQPDDATITVISNKIDSYVTSNPSTRDSFFSTISALSIAISTASMSSFNTSTVSSSGFSNFINAQKAYDLTSADVQQCRIGLTNDANIKSKVNLVGSNVATIYIKVKFGAKRRRRATVALTCTDIDNAGSAAVSFTSATLDTLSDSEFKTCYSTLGAITTWSSDQLAVLYKKAKILFPSTSQIADADIIKLNSIFLGYPSSELALLSFNSFDTIQYLGVFNTWSTSQLTSGLQTSLTRFIGSTTLTSSNVAALNNIICALPSSTITSNINNGNFAEALPTLKKISNVCPNIQTLYSKAVSNFANLDSITYTEIGALAGGLSPTNIQAISDSNIPFISQEAFAIMPADTVNAMSTSQISQLSSNQISSLTNSPYYSTFSTVFKNSLKSSFGIDVVGSGTNAFYIPSVFSLIFCVFVASTLRF